MEEIVKEKTIEPGVAHCANDRKKRIIGNRRVCNQRGLNLSGTHTVTGNVDYVIHAAGDPVVTIGIATGTVTGGVYATYSNR